MPILQSVSIPLRHEQPPVALDPLYRELHPPLLRFAEGLLGNRSDAEEAVQDAFVALARTGHVDEPRAWLFRVTRNSAVSVLRRRRGSVSLETVAAEPHQPGPDPHRAAELSSEMGVLRVALATLPERNRSALLLRELSGMSYREIASTIDVSEANVKVLIFRARQALQSVTDALALRCADAQLALSAAADGEASAGEHARAALHRAHCPSCRRFAGSIGGQRAGLAALFPMPMSVIGMPALHVAHSAGSAGAAGGATAGGAAGGGGAAAGGAVAGGGLLGAKALLAAGAAAVAIGGGAAALDSHALGRHHHSTPAAPAAPARPSARAFARAVPPVATNDEPVFTRGAAGTDSNSTDGGSDTLPRSGGDTSSSGDGSSGQDRSTSSPSDSTDRSGTTSSGDGGSSSSGSDTTTAPTSGDGGNGPVSTDGGSGSGDGGATTGN